MARQAVTGLVPQYSRNASGDSTSGYWLKFYFAGTTTPLIMYTDIEGGTPLDKCMLNTRGETISNELDDDSVFIPYVDGDYDAYLFYSERAANDNDTDDAQYLGRAKYLPYPDAVQADIDAVLESAAQGNITPFDEDEDYTNQNQWVEQPPRGGIVYRPLRSALPIAAGPFNPEQWVFASDAFGTVKKAPTIDELDDVSPATDGSVALVSGVPFVYDDSVWRSENAFVTPLCFVDTTETIADWTSAINSALSSGYSHIVFPPGDYSHTGIAHTLTKDMHLEFKPGAKLILNSASPINDAVYFATDGFSLAIDGIYSDADDKAFRGLHVRNESSTTLADVFLRSPVIRNVYRSSQAFLGGDGILVRGGYNRVLIENPDVRGVKMASGAGIQGSEGVSGISVVQNFAQTLMPRFVLIKNPHVENIYSENAAYVYDQDGCKLFGMDTELMEEGRAVVLGGTFKNCWGRSIKFQRPDGLVLGTTFVRDAGNSTGAGNSEIDFQRGGGTARDIECHYTNYQPVTIVNSYQNQYETYDFLVDGVSVTLNGTTLTQVVQRSSQATADIAVPVKVNNVKVIGSVTRILRHLTQNSSATDVREYARLENITFGQADYLAQVYGVNNAGQTLKVYTKNCVTTGTSVGIIDQGTFSNAITVELYEEDNRGFSSIDCDSFYSVTLSAASGTVTVNTAEQRLEFSRQGRLCSISGEIRVLSVSSPSGALALNLPLNNAEGTQTSNWVMSPVVVTSSVSKNANDFALRTTDSGGLVYLVDISGNDAVTDVAGQMQVNTRIYVNFQYKTSE